MDEGKKVNLAESSVTAPITPVMQGLAAGVVVAPLVAHAFHSLAPMGNYALASPVVKGMSAIAKRVNPLLAGVIAGVIPQAMGFVAAERMMKRDAEHVSSGLSAADVASRVSVRKSDDMPGLHIVSQPSRF